jgi:putative membrane protein
VTAEARVREKKLNRWAWAVSLIVFLMVMLMRQYKIETAFDFSFLPPLYSFLNTITFFLLIFGYVTIRMRRDMIWHRKIMTTAIVTSACFLLGYMVYHFTSEETSFCRQGLIRPIYFFILISHIILAALILPFILFTYIRAVTGQFARHKAIAKWVFPVWLYVSLSGPVVYLLLKPCYS